jgi:hypothetical protein
MEEANARYKKLVVLLHPDRNPSSNATVEFQAMQEEYRDIPVLLKYLPYFTEPQVVYIPVPAPEQKTSIWDLVRTIAESIPPEGYVEGVRMVAGLFSAEKATIADTE